MIGTYLLLDMLARHRQSFKQPFLKLRNFNLRK